jgi:hypothetical protein
LELKEIWGRNMVPVIERWERYITAAGNKLEPEVSEQELAEFMAGVSNPEDVRAYLDKWEDEEVDIEEKIVVKVEEDTGELEVVVTDDESEDEEDEEEEEDLVGFVVGDDEEEEEEEEEE